MTITLRDDAEGVASSVARLVGLLAAKSGGCVNAERDLVDALMDLVDHHVDRSRLPSGDAPPQEPSLLPVGTEPAAAELLDHAAELLGVDSGMIDGDVWDEHVDSFAVKMREASRPPGDTCDLCDDTGFVTRGRAAKLFQVPCHEGCRPPGGAEPGLREAMERLRDRLGTHWSAMRISEVLAASAGAAPPRQPEATHRCKYCTLTLTDDEHAKWAGCDACDGEGLVQVTRADAEPSAPPSEPDPEPSITHPDTGEDLRPGCSGCGHETTLWECTHMVPHDRRTTEPPATEPGVCIGRVVSGLAVMPAPASESPPPSQAPASSGSEKGQLSGAVGDVIIPNTTGWWPAEVRVWRGRSEGHLTTQIGPVADPAKRDGLDFRWGGRCTTKRPDALAEVEAWSPSSDHLTLILHLDTNDRRQLLAWGGAQAPDDGRLAGAERDRDSAADGFARVTAELDGLRERVDGVLTRINLDERSMCEFGRGRTSGLHDAAVLLRAALGGGS